MKINIDFRFVDILYELHATAKYISAFESQLPIIVKQEERAFERIREECVSVGNDAEDDFNRQEFYDLTENVLPRFYRNAILVTIWAIFEAAIIDIAKELQSARRKTLGFDDLKGNFLDRTKKYFHHILEFPLPVGGKEWKCIKRLQVLRNAIAHCNGRIDNITGRNLEKIKRWEKEKRGISIESGNLMCSKDFIEESYSNVNNFLMHLIAEVKKGNPN